MVDVYVSMFMYEAPRLPRSQSTNVRNAYRWVFYIQIASP